MEAATGQASHAKVCIDIQMTLWDGTAGHFGHPDRRAQTQGKDGSRRGQR